MSNDDSLSPTQGQPCKIAMGGSRYFFKMYHVDSQRVFVGIDGSLVIMVDCRKRNNLERGVEIGETDQDHVV